MLGTRDDVGQFGKHLATIAHAQPKGVITPKEIFELIGQQGIESDGACPANAGTQGVAIAEATAGDHTFEVGQVGAAGLQVGHVHIKGFKASLREGIGHFDMRIDALLAQHRHPGAREQQGRRSIFDS